jgi:hypothetical protein
LVIFFLTTWTTDSSLEVALSSAASFFVSITLLIGTKLTSVEL